MRLTNVDEPLGRPPSQEVDAGAIPAQATTHSYSLIPRTHMDYNKMLCIGAVIFIVILILHGMTHGGDCWGHYDPIQAP